MKRSKSIFCDEKLRIVLRWLAALFFVLAGINHFVHPAFYDRMVPPILPASKMLIVISGLGEIAGGLGLLIQPLRRTAGWGLIVLLVAIFPANIYMALHPEKFGIAPAILWARLPLQVVFIAWIWWVALYRFGKERIKPD